MDIPASWMQYVSAVRYRWKTATLVSLTAAVLLVAVVTKMPRRYSATTTILVDPQKVPDRYVSSTVTEDPNERLNTITQEVLSRTRLSAIVEQYHLYPKLRASAGMDMVLTTMRKAIQIQVKAPKEASPTALSAFTITYQSDNQNTVAPVTNRLAQSFIDWNLEVRQSLVEGTTQFLNEELGRARDSLQAQEARVRDYRMQHLGEMPEQMQANLQTLSRLQNEVQTHTDAINRLDQERLVVSQDPTASTTAAPVMQTPRQRLRVQIAEARRQVDELAGRYTDQHPDLVSARERLQSLETAYAHLSPDSPATPATAGPDSDLAARLRLIDQQRRQHQAEIARLQQQVSRYQRLVDAVPAREAEESGLMRDYESAKDNYKSLLEKSYSAEMATELERKQQAERFTILDPAVRPDHSESPHRSVLYAMVLALSCLLGPGVAIGLELMDGTVKSEEEFRAMLPATMLLAGVIPPLHRRATSTAASGRTA